MSKQITGAEIQRHDLIKSAAMRQPERVESINVSSTGRTVEVLTERHVYRIGCNSKVRLIGLGCEGFRARYEQAACSKSLDDAAWSLVGPR